MITVLYTRARKYIFEEIVNLYEMEDFTSLLNVLGKAYSAVDLRFLSVKLNEKLFCTHGAIRFTHRTTDEVIAEYEILTERLGSREIDEAKILFNAYPFEKWHIIMKQFEAGRLQIDEESMYFFEPMPFDKIFIANNLLTTEESKEWEIKEFFYDFRREETVQVSNVLRQIDFKKSGYKYGEEFGKAWIKMINLQFQVPRIVFGLPVYVHISGAEPLTENELKVHVKCHKELLPLSLKHSTYKSNIDWPFEKNSVSLESSDAAIKGDFAYLETPIGFTYGPKHQVYLAVVHEEIGKIVEYGKASIEYIESRKKELEAPPLGIISKFAGDFEKSLLQPYELQDPEFVFERTVYWLFTLAQFEAYWLKGADQLKIGEGFSPGGADILVCDSESRLYLLVNCTLNPPRSEKINKIKNVSDYFSNNLNVVVRPLEVVAQDARASKVEFGHITKIFDYHDLHMLIQTLKEKGRKELREKILEMLRV